MDKLSQSPSFFNDRDESSARKDIDAILFDVDGVLIDTRLSYNLAIKKTVKHVLAIVSSVEPIQSVSDSILLRMRRTGGFNNDTDTTYALILTSLVSQSTSTKELESLLFDITNKIDAGGIISVERYLSTLFSRTAVEKRSSSPYLPILTDISRVGTLPLDLLEKAEDVRRRCVGMSERLIRREVRDPLDRERLRLGVTASGGLQGIEEGFAEKFDLEVLQGRAQSIERAWGSPYGSALFGQLLG